MRLSTALLADAATVREGLLHVLGGGVTTMGRSSFPAPMDVALALVMHVHPTELGSQHTLRVQVQGADGQFVASADAQWGPLSVAGDPPLHEIGQPVVLDLRNVPLPASGDYSVELLIDNIHQGSLRFTVTDMAGGELPGLAPQDGLE